MQTAKFRFGMSTRRMAYFVLRHVDKSAFANLVNENYDESIAAEDVEYGYFVMTDAEPAMAGIDLLKLCDEGTPGARACTYAHGRAGT